MAALSEMNTQKDFHKAGYTYAFFWWGLFTIYCLVYQVDRFLLYRTRRQRLCSKEKNGGHFTIRSLFSFLQPLNRVIYIPCVTSLIPIKHVLGAFLFIVINLIFVFFAPFKLDPEVPYWQLQSVGLMDRRAAYIGMVNWSFVFVLGSRNTVVTRMSGLTFEALIPFHRWVARIGLAEFIMHWVWRIIHGYQKTYIVKDALFLDIEQGTGTMAMVGFLIIFATSLEYIRRNFFEFFYGMHLTGIIIAIAAACWHEAACFYYFIPAVILWVCDRLWRSYQSWCVHVKALQVDAVTPPQDGDGDHGMVRVLFEYGRLSRYHPGQYVFVAIVNKTRKAFWQYANWHPITISEVFRSFTPRSALEDSNSKTKKDDDSYSNSSSIVSQLRKDNALRAPTVGLLHIKALGSYTRQLYQAAAMANQEFDLKVDGPYGPILDYQDYQVLVCFAAGIGITPALTLIKDCVERRSAGVKTVVTEQVHLVWAIRVLDELDVFMDLLIYWTQQRSKAALPIQLHLDIYVTRSVKADKHWLQDLEGCRVKFGQRPNVGQCMESIEEQVQSQSVWVHTCGSDEFMRSVMNEAVKRRWKAHHETFEF